MPLKKEKEASGCPKEKVISKKCKGENRNKTNNKTNKSKKAEKSKSKETKKGISVYFKKF